MVAIGVHVGQGAGRPGLLADLFKNTMSDPSTVAEMALRREQIFTERAQQRNYDAAVAKANAEAAKTAEENRQLGILQATRDKEGPLLGKSLGSHVPQPIPVDVTPRAAQQIIGPGPAIVSTDAQQAYEDLRKAQEAAGPLIVQQATGAGDFAQGAARSYGTGTLAAGLGPGGPAAVDLTPDQMRIGATLATGNLPSTTTVMTSGDTAGTDAAARQQIAVDAAKASGGEYKEVNGVPGMVKNGVFTPVANAPPAPLFGPTGIDAARGIIARGDAIIAQKGKIDDPVFKAAYDEAQRAARAADVKAFPKDSTVGTLDEKGNLVPVAGMPAQPAPGPFTSTGAEGDNRRVTYDTAVKIAHGGKPTLDEAIAYASGYVGLWGSKLVPGKDAAQRDIWVRDVPDEAKGYPTPEDVYALAGGTGALPVAGATAAPTPAVPGVPGGLGEITAPVLSVTGVGGAPAVAPVVPAAPAAATTRPKAGDPISGAVPPGTDAQRKLRAFVREMQPSAIYLNTLDENHLPGLLPTAVLASINSPSATTETTLGALASLMTQDAVLHPEDREYNQAILNFTSYDLYQNSGAASTYPEWVRQRIAMMPQYGDHRALLQKKAKLRSIAVQSFAMDAWQNDPASLNEFLDNSEKLGLPLNFGLGADPPLPKTLEGDTAAAPTAGQGAIPAAPKGFAEIADPASWPAVYQALTPAQQQFWSYIPSDEKRLAFLKNLNLLKGKKP